MKKNSQNIFLELYKPLHDQLTRYCRAIAGTVEDAEDLMHDTLINAMENFEKLRNYESFKPFLFSIAGNLNKMKLRRKKFRAEIKEEEIAQIIDQGQNPEHAAEFCMIYEKLMLLPAKMSETMILFHISDFSLEEIRKIQGGSLSGVKLRLKRGREKLFNILNTPEQVKSAILFLTL